MMLLQMASLSELAVSTLNQQNAFAASLTNKDHPQATSCTPIYLGKLVTLSATSVLIQQNQHGDYKQNDMASFAKTLYKAPTKSERNVFSVSDCRFFNSFRTVREHMYGSFD